MRSNQRPPGLSRTGRFRPVTRGSAYRSPQLAALARGEERARGVASQRPELGDREKRLAPPMQAVLDAPAAPRELGGKVPHEQVDAGVERHPARYVATHPRVGRQRAWPREW